MQPVKDDRDRRVGTTPTRRLLFGRIIKLCLDNGFGFIRGPRGRMVYFDSRDAADFGRLRVGARVRFELDPVRREHAIRISAT